MNEEIECLILTLQDLMETGRLSGWSPPFSRNKFLAARFAFAANGHRDNKQSNQQ
jgi:hypothetical protein